MRKPHSRLAANKSVVENVPEKSPKPALDLTALQQTPGFMIRILQIQIFEEFFAYFSAADFSPAEHSALITVRDNPDVTQSEVASSLRIQLPNLVKLPPQLCPAKAERYNIRTMVERVFSRLKDEFGANTIRVRGAKKVMAHLMFSVSALTVDQLLRLKT